MNVLCPRLRNRLTPCRPETSRRLSICGGYSLPSVCHLFGFDGIEVNYAEHIFKSFNNDFPAIIFKSEKDNPIEICWKELKNQTAKLANYLKSLGIESGDCIVGYLPTIPEASISFLAANSIGAVWSSSSPDFGLQSVIDRFKQIELIGDYVTKKMRELDKHNAEHDIKASPVNRRCITNIGTFRAYLEAYLDQHGPSAQAYFLLGIIRDAVDDAIQAEKLFRKTLYLNPNHEEALFLLSLLAEQTGDVTEAKNLKQRIARLKDNTVPHS